MTAATDTLLRSMSESQLLDTVTEALTLYHWRFTHHRRSDRAILMGQIGFPDVVAVRGRFLIALELKTEQGRVTPEQMAWLDAFNECPAVTAMVIRPRDLDLLLGLLA